MRSLRQRKQQQYYLTLIPNTAQTLGYFPLVQEVPPNTAQTLGYSPLVQQEPPRCPNTAQTLGYSPLVQQEATSGAQTLGFFSLVSGDHQRALKHRPNFRFFSQVRLKVSNILSYFLLPP